MFLFIISFFLVFITSYFITSILVDEKKVNGIFYFLISAFANIVLTMEVLSLFSFISIPGVFILNIFFLIVSILLWNKFGRPIWKLSFGSFFSKYINCIKQDKSLFILSVGFLISVLTALFMSSFMPIMNFDAESYHALRSLFWINNHNLNHFNIADMRNLVFPINSELVYAWVFLFIRRSAWIMYTSFGGFLLVIFGIYNILSFLKFSMRRKLWVIFMVSSLSSVLAQITTTETDIIIAGLIISSIYLFWYSVKEKKTVPLFMSALAYALAIGTKSTALIAIPACAIGYGVLSYYYYGKYCYRVILKFIWYGILNFLLFSSYNYILNFINYGNMFGSKFMLASHGNEYGFRAIVANFIKYIFMFVDFAGFMWNEYLAVHIENLRNSILSLLNMSMYKDGCYTLGGNRTTLIESVMGMGILGLILYLPFWIYSLISPIFSRKKSDFFIFAFAILLLLNLFFMSYKLAFMSYSIRFLTCFCVISSPILVYSYSKRMNLYKFFIVLFSIYYLFLVSTHLYTRPFAKIVGYFKEGYTISQIRYLGQCSLLVFLDKLSVSDKANYQNICINETCLLKNYIKTKINPKNKIIFFANAADRLFLIMMLDVEGYNIDFGVLEDIENIDMSKYNLAIFDDNKQISSNIKQFEKRKFDIYFSDSTIYDRTNSGNYCVYERYPGEIISAYNNVGKVPFIVKCYYTDDYLLKNFKFKYLTEYNVDLSFGNKAGSKNQDYIWKYRVFENLENPVIVK